MGTNAKYISFKDIDNELKIVRIDKSKDNIHYYINSDSFIHEHIKDEDYINKINKKFNLNLIKQDVTYPTDLKIYKDVELLKKLNPSPIQKQLSYLKSVKNVDSYAFDDEPNIIKIFYIHSFDDDDNVDDRIDNAIERLDEILLHRDSTLKIINTSKYYDNSEDDIEEETEYFNEISFKVIIPKDIKWLDEDELKHINYHIHSTLVKIHEFFNDEFIKYFNI